jgi:hypothetical protein
MTHTPPGAWLLALGGRRRQGLNDGALPRWTWFDATAVAGNAPFDVRCGPAADPAGTGRDVADAAREDAYLVLPVLATGESRWRPRGGPKIAAVSPPSRAGAWRLSALR